MSGHPLWSRYSIPEGQSVVLINGVFKLHPYPWLGTIQNLEEGVEWFNGGRTYEIDIETAEALAQAGFEVTP